MKIIQKLSIVFSSNMMSTENNIITNIKNILDNLSKKNHQLTFIIIFYNKVIEDIQENRLSEEDVNYHNSSFIKSFRETLMNLNKSKNIEIILLLENLKYSEIQKENSVMNLEAIKENLETLQRINNKI
jgi:hypothetical protein